MHHITFHSSTGNAKFQNLINRVKTTLLNIEIEDCCIHIHFLKKHSEKLITELKSLIPSHLLNDIIVKQSKNNDNFEMKIREKHSKKFDRQIEKLNLTENKNNHENQKRRDWFKNLTEYQIPDNVIDIVSLGPKFSPPHEINRNIITDYIKNIENFINTHNVNEKLANIVRNDLIDNINNNTRKTKHINVKDRMFAQKLNETKYFLKNHKDLIFTQADKGNTTVAISKKDYVKKIQSSLADENTYTKVDDNPLKTLRESTYNILSRWNHNHYLNYTYKNTKLTQTDTQLPVFYGLPKIHKEGIPLRPIISTINSPTYFLAKHLYNELSKCIKPPNSRVKNNFEIAEKLKDINIPPNFSLISLDVKSLFTNIDKNLLKEGLDKRFSQIHNKSKIPFDEIQEATEFLMNNTYFKFNETYYKQTFGAPMGSPTSGLFADIVMDDLETSCLNKLSFTPLFFYRYVDDIMTCIPTIKINEIISVFNSYNERLQFTYELENNNSINFLDLKFIKQTDGNLKIDWYTKPTFSGRFLNYNSKHPFSQKIAMVYNLTDRAVKLTDKSFHEKNLKTAEYYLKNNDYPLSFIKKYTNKRLQFLKHNKNSHRQNDSLRRRKKYIVLPYVKNLYEKVSLSLKRFYINTIPTVKNNMTHIVIKAKDKIKMNKNNNTVYCIKCKDCTATYIGQTKRDLECRVKEHIKKREGVIHDHTAQLNHNFDFEKYKILDKEKILSKRLISEMIHINLQINPINKREDTQKLSQCYKHLFEKIKFLK